MLRAYDKATGKEAGAVYMPAPQTGSPMTYMLNGKQYIVVAISGAGLHGRAGRVPAARGGSDDHTLKLVGGWWCGTSDLPTTNPDFISRGFSPLR